MRGEGRALKPYERADGEGEYVLAVAAHAASVLNGAAPAAEESQLEAIIRTPPLTEQPSRGSGTAAVKQLSREAATRISVAQPLSREASASRIPVVKPASPAGGRRARPR